MKPKKITFTLTFLAIILTILAPLEGSSYCLDRQCSQYPNTGYCTMYGGAYHCLPGGYTCDGDEEHGPKPPCFEGGGY